MKNEKLEEIACNFIDQYEKNENNIDLYSLYADLKRTLESKEKESELIPLFENQVNVKNKNTILKMDEGKLYVYEEIDYYSGKVIFQMIVNSWNAGKKLSQFDIIQVLFGDKFEKYLPDDIYDTDKTTILYKDEVYTNKIKFYKYKEEMLNVFKKEETDRLNKKFPQRGPQPKGYGFLKGQREC